MFAAYNNNIIAISFVMLSNVECYEPMKKKKKKKKKKREQDLVR